MQYLRCLACMLFFFIAACASSLEQAADQIQFVQTPISPSQPFKREGRFAVHAEQFDQSMQAVQGRFSWYDDGQQLVLELRNPLGHVMAQLQVNEQGAWLQEPRAGMRYAQDADALAEEIFEQPIPVQGLRFWLRGLASHQVKKPRYESARQLVSANDQGWRLNLSNYDALGPQRLLLVFQQGGQRVTVRIVIDGEPS